MRFSRLRGAAALTALSLVLVTTMSCGSSSNSADAPDGGAPAKPKPDAGPPPPPPPIVDIRADTNRNGTVDLDDPTEAAGKTTWDAKHGAVFLANIDDDESRCKEKDPATGQQLGDLDLAVCNDASDEVVNGEDDLLDLARIKTKPWGKAPDGATATITLSSPGDQFVRLFKNDAGTFNVFDIANVPLTTDEIRNGVELAIEGKDIVRDTEAWNGFVDVSYNVTFKEKVTEKKGVTKTVDKTVTDTVRMRVAPALTYHHVSAAENVYVSSVRATESVAFQLALNKAVVAAKVPQGLVSLNTNDQWAQDFFETGFMSMPAAGGTQHVIRVAFRSANKNSSPSAKIREKFPLRPAGRLVFTALRGKDFAGIQEFDPAALARMDSLNSFGNTETIPPFTLGEASFPLGRVLRGSIPEHHPDERFSKMLEAQLLQPPVNIDTSWLLVGHVDESLSFVKANSPRGWVVLANDPVLSRKILAAEAAKGNGSVKMFTGQSWVDLKGTTPVEVPAERSIDDVLADASIMSISQKAAVKIDAQLAILKSETGITPAEIVRIPFLSMSTMGRAIAYQPGTVNVLVMGESDIAAPDPHGPIIDGKDVMKTPVESALAPYHIKVHWVDDWNLYHRLEGEVHCGTNSVRETPTAKWWEAGR